MSEPYTNRLIVKDGDMVLLVANDPEATVFDPMGDVAAVHQSYRVVADKATKTLELVAIGPTGWMTPLELERAKDKTVL
jgi:hypothetical protein